MLSKEEDWVVREPASADSYLRASLDLILEAQHGCINSAQGHVRV